MSEERRAFTDAMSAAATGVTVVATEGPAGRFAQTVSAVCSVSADPPTVLACLHRRSPVVDAIVANGAFAISVLSDAQAGVADAFAGRGPVPYDFGCADWRAERPGCPVVAGAVATFDCRVENAVATGTHMVFVGGVLRSARADGTPLVYCGRAYGRPLTLAA